MRCAAPFGAVSWRFAIVTHHNRQGHAAQKPLSTITQHQAPARRVRAVRPCVKRLTPPVCRHSASAHEKQRNSWLQLEAHSEPSANCDSLFHMLERRRGLQHTRRARSVHVLHGREVPKQRTADQTQRNRIANAK